MMTGYNIYNNKKHFFNSIIIYTDYGKEFEGNDEMYDCFQIQIMIDSNKNISICHKTEDEDTVEIESFKDSEFKFRNFKFIIDSDFNIEVYYKNKFYKVY